MSCCSIFRGALSGESEPLIRNPVEAQLRAVVIAVDAYLVGKQPAFIGKKRIDIAKGAGNMITKEVDIDTELTTCKVQLATALKNTAQALIDSRVLSQKRFNSRLQHWYHKARKIGWLGRQLTLVHQKSSGDFEGLFYNNQITSHTGRIQEQLNSIQATCSFRDEFSYQDIEGISRLMQAACEKQYMAEKQRIVSWAESFERQVTSPSCCDTICSVM